VNEILDKAFKRMIIRLIHEIEEDTYKHLKEFEENTNKQLDRIRKTIET
jgi:hypothetical protein